MAYLASQGDNALDDGEFINYELDYNNAIGIRPCSPFTAPKDGIICYDAGVDGAFEFDKSGFREMRINNKSLYHGVLHCSYEVRKGDTIYFSAGSFINSFIPYKKRNKN
ncbi:hypothetical protein [Selenomonas ruminantium]|uniref:hypothetical protein n=1 Tax=Selenomonas ruminantium TaxID=971 RepID=UPI0026F25812|nr:hypothetical protein [Selenomonas ruminantium]